MLKIINAAESIEKLFIDGNFKLELWDAYIDSILPNHRNLFLEDMKDTIASGRFNFENDYLPILNAVLMNKEKRIKAVDSFAKVTVSLDEKIVQTFGKTLDVTIILYVGLCNGAGWVVNLESKQYVLLGIEKIIELDWCDINAMYGLIYHELGHIYQMQYGILTREYKGTEAFLWQLFMEGIAMYFEQRLIGDDNFFHQNMNGWLEWCDTNIYNIKIDFNNDLTNMTSGNQRYFGDWVRYNGQSDVGYYLGARFVQWLNKRYTFDEMIHFDISIIRAEWDSYLNC
ncbi:MAG: hypothetical protein ACOX8S_12075 [Christensenellales bacterium]|jgi:uncharacterized protein YjaZ